MRDLKREIEEKRSKLSKLVLLESLTSVKVIKLSQELDKLIDEYIRTSVCLCKDEAACSYCDDNKE